MVDCGSAGALEEVAETVDFSDDFFLPKKFIMIVLWWWFVGYQWHTKGNGESCRGFVSFEVDDQNSTNHQRSITCESRV